MINIIGAKRIVVLLALVGLNVALSAFLYLYAVPENESTTNQIQTLRSKTISVQSDIDRMQMEFEQLGQQQDKFDSLKASGFFDLQDRGVAKDLMKSIQEESNVISAVANIKAGYIDENAEADKAGHFILVSPVDIQIKAFDDADIYRYLEIAQHKFPGLLTIEHLDINRIKDVNAPILRAIAAGANPELLEARIELFWTTMVPKAALAEGSGDKNAQ